jgi:hypothetical protein
LVQLWDLYRLRFSGGARPARRYQQLTPGSVDRLMESGTAFGALR